MSRAMPRATTLRHGGPRALSHAQQPVCHLAEVGGLSDTVDPNADDIIGSSGLPGRVNVAKLSAAWSNWCLLALQTRTLVSL